MVKNCDLGLKNAALGLRPRAVFSRPRSQFFTIRTSQPANNIYLFITFGDKNYGNITIKIQNTTYYIYISNQVKFSTSRNK